ncbi:hypothetical protein HPG69_007581 [Diceros bicornis minor]|uniref:Vomeronasal type-1 receptor n=1 Tax=Diceros bicornis minor TaxID=77932 RepID=A0A7J7EF23_DICBM|nr:hypothetical protein HPG69_007581 [Diceros bicornis minor]
MTVDLLPTQASLTQKMTITPWDLTEWPPGIWHRNDPFITVYMSSDVSTGTTCLLGVFQAITISPRNSMKADPKFSLYFSQVQGNLQCPLLDPEHLAEYYSSFSIYVALVLFSDAFCLGLMIWSSGSTVFILQGHRQQVQYIHKSNLSPRSSPETTAMQSIPVLVCTFLSLWTPSSIIHICLVVINSPSLLLVNTSTPIDACFPTLSPYILMSHDPRVSRLCFPWKGIQSLKLIINM